MVKQMLIVIQKENLGTKIIILKVSARIKAVKVIPTKFYKNQSKSLNPARQMALA